MTRPRKIWHAISYVAALVAFTAAPRALADDPLYPSFDAFLAEIDRIEAIGDAGERTAALNTFWTGLTAAGQAPYAQDGRVAMLYRGAANSIGFAGDANGWNPSAWPANPVPGTDLWVRLANLPNDARVDYKVVRNGGQWILDPSNPHQQWSGFGPNSELRMPDYVFPEETVRAPGVVRGALSGNQRLTSTNLGADVNVRVYTPAGYDALDDLPVVYVTDGHEYLDDRLGAIVAVLDNRIADGSLRPAIAVFIDPRDPNNPGDNRRMGQLGGNQKPQFADFIAQELVPTIDAGYKTSPQAEDRVILGTSLGGLFSAFMAARHDDVISNAVIQSPAFWFDTSIYDTYRNNPALAESIRIYMESGTINDGTGGPTMRAILQAGGYDFVYDEINQGHSWGHWKGELDDALIHLLGAGEVVRMGDANQDGVVDLLDFNILAVRWGSITDRGALDGDFDHSGVVDLLDLDILAQTFGSSAPAQAPAAAPEPAGAALLTGGAALGALRRR
ncbi:MAG: alpha/beta hydrolase-fold protein [Planctomycetota bacterium]